MQVHNQQLRCLAAELTDRELVDWFDQDPEQALRELEGRYQNYCYQIAYRILRCREDAEECVNDILLCCWEVFPRETPACLRAFLGTATRNLAVSYYRRSHADRRGGSVQRIPIYDNMTAERWCFEAELCDSILIRQCLHTLLAGYPAADRRLFWRRYYWMQPIAALAAEFSLSEGCVKSRLLRMRDRLRRELEQRGITVS